MIFIRLLVFILFLTVISKYYVPSYAATNCCYGNGGLYGCDTQTGQVYCKDGSVSNYCTCQSSGSPSSTPIPTAIPTQSVQNVSCPVNASFDEELQECICSSNYVASNGECISENDYCWNKYGGNSIFNSNTGSCTCETGYIWNSNNTSCLSLNSYCQNNLGNNSYYNNSNNTCSCDQGFVIQNGQCVMEVIQQPTITVNTSQPVVTTLPILPTIAEAIASPSGKQVKKISIQQNTDSNKKINKNPYKLHLKLTKFKIQNLSNTNVIQHFFHSIWVFIQGIFGVRKSNTGIGTSTDNTQINTSKYQLPIKYQQ